MSRISRRAFIAKTSAAAALAFARPNAAMAAANYGGFRVGSQSYSFRHFRLPDALAKLKELNLGLMEFSSVHFKPDAGAPEFAEVKKTIAAAGIIPVGYGVEDFTADKAANRKKFEFGKALGVEYLSANPTPEAFDDLDALTQEFNIKIAIHNHGPGARYDKVEDTLKAVNGRNPLIGACLDTGHCLRSHEHPQEAIQKLGARLHAMHLKDWKFDGPEQPVGEGDMKLPEVAKALKALGFNGAVNLEFELDETNPVPRMQKGLENWAKAIASA